MLYQTYLTPIYHFAFRQVGNRSEAEDITSDVFLKMVRGLPEFRGESSFKNWLYCLAKNTAADYWRRHYQKPLTSLDGQPEISSPVLAEAEDIESLMERKETAVKKILSLLPENYRQVLELRFLKNYSLRETAAELNLTLGNTKVIQYRALKKAGELSIKI